MCSKYYTLRINQSNDENSLLYCKKFNSLSVLFNYFITNYRISDLDKYCFDEFEIHTVNSNKFTDDSDNSCDSKMKIFPIPKISDFFSILE